MKVIVHINDKLTIAGGVEVYISEVQHLLREKGWQSYWISLTRKGDQVFIASENELHCWNGPVNALNSSPIAQLVKNGNGLFHVHSLSEPKVLLELFKISPVIRSMHEPRIVCPGQGKFWRKSERICNIPFGLHCMYHAYKEGCCNRHPKSLLKAYNNVAFETTTGNQGYKAIIAMSSYMIEEAIKVGYYKDKLILNPYFTPIVEERDEYEINNDAKSLLFVGRLSRTKGVHYFIRSGIDLLDNGYNIKLDIVGDGNDKNYFTSLVPEHYKDRIIFHGWKSKEEVNKILNNSYIMIFPSIYPEAFGISGIEAMMNGKPVVGFDVGGVSTWLKDGETGFLVPVKHSKSLIEKVELLINNTDLYKKMSNRSREVALKEFSPDKHFKVLEEIYIKSFEKK